MTARTESARAKSSAREESAKTNPETKVTDTSKVETNLPENSADTPADETAKGSETSKDETPKDKPEGNEETGKGSEDSAKESADGSKEGEKSSDEKPESEGPVSLLTEEEREKIRVGAKAAADATGGSEEEFLSTLLASAEARKAEERAKAAEEAFTSALKEITEKREKELSVVRKFLPGYKAIATPKSSAARSVTSGRANGNGFFRNPKSIEVVRAEGARTKRGSLTGRAILAAYDEEGTTLAEISEIARSLGLKDSEKDAYRILTTDVAYIKGYGLRKETIDGVDRFFLVLPEGLDSPVFKD